MPRKKTPTLEHALQRYLRVNSDWAPTTATNTRALLNKFVREMGPDRQVHLLAREDVEDWLLAAGDRQQASSFNKVRSRLNAFLGWCIDMGWLDINPAASIKRRKVVQKERLRLSPAQLLELQDHTPNERDRALIALACNTALRGNELSALRVRDLDLETGHLHVVISKSAKEDVMPVTADLDAAMQRWLRAYREDAGDLQPDWYLIPAREPGHGRFIQEKGVLGGTYQFHIYGALLPHRPLRKPWEIVKRAMVHAGHTIGPGEGCHTIRRSVARAFYDLSALEGHDSAVRMVSALLHHEHSQTTERYVGLGAERLKRDDSLRGRQFLSALAPDTGGGSVIPIARTGAPESPNDAQLRSG